MFRRCIMGCPPGEPLHLFPENKSKRAEWCRILGVYPRTKKAFLCNAHIPECYLFGNRLSKFAMPTPPDVRQTTNIKSQSSEKSSRSTVFQFSKYANETFIVPRQPVSAESSVPTVSHNLIANEMKAGKFPENLSNAEPVAIEISAKDQNKNVEAPANGEKVVEDFEIRNKSNNDMIIKGRYFQTNDYLVVSYTPPKKWALQEQVKMLENMYAQHMGQIKTLTKEKLRLLMELRKYDKLLPKLRYLQQQNRLLYAELTLCKINEKNRRKRIKERKLQKLPFVLLE